MVVQIDYVERYFRVRILRGSPDFEQDLEKIRLIHGRRSRYEKHPDTGVSVLSHWDIPAAEVTDILAQWPLEKLMRTESANKQFESLFRVQTPITELPRIPAEEINWKIDPRPHQEFYVGINREKNRLLCSWEVGKGKTPGALERATTLGFKRLLVVCPKKTRTNWASEVFEWYRKECLIYDGTIKQRKKLLDEQVKSAEIVIVSYQKAGELAHLKFDQIIIDEAHLLSRLSAARYKDVHRLVVHNPKSGIQLLSGTPIQHKVPDLWALINMISPEIAGSYIGWIERYIRESQIYKYRLPNGMVIKLARKKDLVNLDELRSRIAPIFVRVKNDDASYADMMDLVTVELTPRQRALYEQVREDLLIELSSTTLSIQTKLARMTRLLQCAEGSFNLDPEWKDSGKLDFLQEVIDNADPDERILIWSRFQEMTNEINRRYPERSVLFNGSVSEKRQELAIWSFQGCKNEFEQRKFDEYLETNPDWHIKPGEAQIFAGVMDPISSLGINLHRFCSRQFITSFHWNGVTMFQAKGRLTRDGQKADKVRTDFLVGERTFERKALTLILRNYQTTLNILDGDRDTMNIRIGQMVKELQGML